ncbi:MAG: hypothetical protein J0I41_22035, partial [Filimonas sp.]|nr:hypothetical protein [Filimonas sp.]
LNLPYQVTVKNDDGTAKGTITYIYDATGNKLEKRTSELAASSNQQQGKQTTTTYLGSYVYENSILQFFGHEEGRVRPVTPPGAGGTSYVYDYFLKDHLGNVRMMLTDEHKTDQYPVATLEAGAVPTEKNYYSIDDGSIVPKNSITGFVYAANSTYANNNGNPPYNTNNTSNVNAESQNLYKINGSSTNKTGLGITLKVMAGDKLSVYGKSYYFQNNTNNDNNYRVPVDQIIMGLLGGAGSVGNSHNITSGDITGGANGNVSMISDLLNTQATTNNATPLKPRAYINYLLFDEQFKCVGTGTSQVGTNGEIKDHNSELGNIAVSKNGYIYVYCSNESPVDVFFDNLQVVHGRGPVLEETHYYPFGLTMAGISSKAAGGIENRNLYNGKEKQDKEFSDGEGLEWYDYGARMYDAQIGRWGTIDPHSENYNAFSPFVYVGNNPLLFIDPDGKDWFYYSKDGKAAATWQWQEGSIYNTGVKDANGNDIVLQGTQAVVVFNGSRDEKLGTKKGKEGYIDGEGAVTASVTVYGPDGANDVHTYKGYTMGSDAQKFGAIDEGTYDGNYDAAGKSGSLQSHWAINKRGNVRTLDGGVNPNAPDQIDANGEGYKDGIFIHSSNSTGFAGTYYDKKAKKDKGISVGCLLIAPNDWKSFNEVMSGVKDFKIEVIRSISRKIPLQGVNGQITNISIIRKTIKND